MGSIAEMAEYEKDKPADFENAIRRVAIVGAGGTVGAPITAALLSTGVHIVTALSRVGSKNSLPSGVVVANIDYNDEASIVTALRNQQFLIITMAPAAPRDTHSKLVQAAAKAGVPYVMPNGYGPDIHKIKLGEDIFLGPVAQVQRDEIERLGMQWVTMCCGFWYDYSLAGGASRYGLDFNSRSMTFYDDGETKISTSTLSQVGRAVKELLSLPLLPHDANDGRLTLSRYFNKGVCFDSFTISQNDLFASVMRVTGTSYGDWTILRESSAQRYNDGMAQVKKGNAAGFSKLLYARAFFPNDPSLLGDLQNKVLGLPREDLDEATKGGVDMVKVLQSRADRMASAEEHVLSDAQSKNE